MRRLMTAVHLGLIVRIHGHVHHTTLGLAIGGSNYGGNYSYNVYTMCSHYQEGALQDLDTTTSPRLSKLELLLEFLHTEAEILLLGYVGQ